MFNKSPRHAVCCVVLNLLSQDGFRLDCSALAEAYRVTTADTGTLSVGVGPKPVVQHHAHSRVIVLYHKF